jgi:hypothetical protein
MCNNVMTFHRTIHSLLIPKTLHGIKMGLELRRRFFQALREALTSPIWTRTVLPGMRRDSSGFAVGVMSVDVRW